MYSYFYFDLKMIKYPVVLSIFYTFYESHFFPGKTPVPPRSRTGILNFSHEPMWVTCLTGVSKFNHRDRIVVFSSTSHYINQKLNYSQHDPVEIERFRNLTISDTITYRGS